MGIHALEPFGLALADYVAGNSDAVLTLHSDLGEHDEMPVSIFFRAEDGFYPFERAALEQVRGRVLDLGAGAGVHALALQQRGHDVTAIDVVPQAVVAMRSRGVRDARCADFLAPRVTVEPADTVLMLMNGPGPCGTLEGLDHFLSWASRLLRDGGQLLIDSGVARPRDDAPAGPVIDWPTRHSAYHGEAWIRLEYKGRIGPPFQELYVDHQTLARSAAARGWECDVFHHGEADTYVARLQRA